jgi:hypothetical protein
MVNYQALQGILGAFNQDDSQQQDDFLDPMQSLRRRMQARQIMPEMGSQVNPRTMALPMQSQGQTLTGPPPQADAPFVPRTEQFDRMAKLAQQMPNEDNFEITKKRRILAALAGAGQTYAAKGDINQGMALGDSILHEPYFKARNQWQAQMDALKPLVTVEEQANNTARAARQTEVTNNYNQGKLTDLEAKNQIAIQKAEDARIAAERKANTADMRAEAYAFSKDNPAWKAFTNTDGEVVFINPTDPTQINKTGVKVTDLTPKQKEQLKIQGDISVANIRAKATTDAATIGADSRKAVAGINAGAKAPKGSPAPKPPVPLTPAAETKSLILKAQEAVSAHPEWKNYIKITPQGVTIPETWANTFGFKKDVRDAAYQAVFGNRTPVVRQPDVIPNSGGNQGQGPDPKRQQAIDALSKAKKPLTEANIQFVMKQLGQ